MSVRGRPGNKQQLAPDNGGAAVSSSSYLCSFNQLVMVVVSVVVYGAALARRGEKV